MILLRITSYNVCYTKLLRTFVENEFNFTSDLSKKEFIEKSVYAFKELGIDTLVLGCTHFIHVEKEILEAFVV